MKRLIIGLVLLLLNAGCFEGPTGPQGDPGMPGTNGITSWTRIIAQSDQTWNGDLKCYLILFEDSRFTEDAAFELWIVADEGYVTRLEDYVADYYGQFILAIMDGMCVFNGPDLKGKTIIIYRITPGN